MLNSRSKGLCGSRIEVVMRQTAQEAFGRWPGILTALGVDSKFLKNEHGPCPACHGKDRFRFDDKGNGMFYCSKCGSGDGFILLYLIHGWVFQKAADEVDRVLGLGVPKTEPKPEISDERKRNYMKQLWRESKPATHGDPVWNYLSNRCGTDPSPFMDDIRFHPGLKHSSGETFPAMLAMMGWDGDRFSGIHRTWIHEGKKAPVTPAKKEWGNHGIIRLGPATDTLGIAEGIETAIAASARFGFPFWSGVCSSGLEGWVPPSNVVRVLIAGDCDSSFTGQAAAFALAKRLRTKGLEVMVYIPEAMDTDWADYAPKLGQVA